jgi:5,10-methylenetetrahydromethanopterin reductase
MRAALGFNPVMSAEEMARVALEAEREGYDSLWMHESLYQRDIVTYIAAMTASTSSIRLGSGIINTFTRHPVTAASTFATLSELSKGRVILGLGLGSFPTIPLIGHQIFPVKETKPLRRVREYVEVLRKTWSGGKVDFDGRFFRVHGLTLGFEVKYSIPLFIASLSPRTQAFAAAVADGVILSPALSTVKETEAMVGNVKKGEEKRGGTVERASYMLTSVDRGREKAVSAVRDYYFFVYQLSEVVVPASLAPYGVTEERLAPLKSAWRRGDIPEAKRLVPEEAIEALTVVGTPDQAKDKVAEYAKSGITLPILMPIGDQRFAMAELAPNRR